MSSELSMKTGIKDILLDELRNLAYEYNLQKLIIFGSRARGDFKPLSDIDLAFEGGDGLHFIFAVEEETSTLLFFDIVNLDGTVQPELRESITQEGLILYEKI